MNLITKKKKKKDVGKYVCVLCIISAYLWEGEGSVEDNEDFSYLLSIFLRCLGLL